MIYGFVSMAILWAQLQLIYINEQLSPRELYVVIDEWKQIVLSYKDFFSHFKMVAEGK